MEAKDNPSTVSSDYGAMIPKWEMVADILEGPDAIRKKAAAYLPKYEKESDAAWRLRVASSPWRPEFEDGLRGICAKPFTRKVAVESAPDVIIGVMDEASQSRRGGLVDDIDGQGNSLHVFARDVFEQGVAKGLAAVYVAYPDTSDIRTQAEAKAANVKPYWVLIKPEEIIAVYWKKIGGKEVLSHIRMRENSVERVGFSEIVRKRIRVIDLDDAGNINWQVWKAVKSADGKEVWEIEAEGRIVGPKSIPVALFFTGQRFGNHGVVPPLHSLADMQIELYRAMSRKDEVMTYAGSPMLKGTGMEPPTKGEEITVGPKTVLFAPPSMDGVQPDWDFIQPNAANIKEVREDVDGIISDMRRLALQPMTPESGSMVATASAIDAAKANSAVQVWANSLKDTLEQAFVFTSQFLGFGDTITVDVNTDFVAGALGDASLNAVVSLRKNSDLSRKSALAEMQRRSVLGPSFDHEKNEEELAEEQQGLEPEISIDPVTGEPIGQPNDVAGQAA